MLELRVWIGCCNKPVYHKKPRRYMCNWSFDQIMNYAKEELIWQDIDLQKVDGFEISCKSGHWVKSIMKNNEG